MTNTAARRLTIPEFLVWDDGTDARYELLDGVAVAMAPPGRAHRVVAGNLIRRIAEALERRPPCTVEPEAGIVSPARRNTLYQADIAVTCTPTGPDTQEIANPILIIEVLSPSTEARDRRRKLPDYRAIPSVREIVLVDPRQPCCEIHRRLEGERWTVELLQEPEARLRLDSIGFDLPLAAIYANVPLERVDNGDAAF